MSSINLLDAIEDPHLFKRWFRDPNSWASWFAFLRAVFALPMTLEQVSVHSRCTGRAEPPTARAKEAWLVCGRRAGKSFILALVAVFLACFYDYRQSLAPGERGTVFVIARDRKQARTILRYIRALLTDVPMLARLVERETAESFDLRNSVTIEVATASFRSVRGYTLVAVLLDELAFWTVEGSANPDAEILAALRPAMATIPNAMLLVASSPYARRGSLWDAHRKHYGKEHDPALVWQAPTRTMNPTVPEDFIAAEYERDPISAVAEYGAEFRTDVESFVNLEVVQACISLGVFERPPRPGLKYSAFTDPSGGSADAFTLAIGHKDTETLVLDAIREVRPPFSPEGVIAEFAVLLKSYRVTKVTGDRYAGEFPRELFRKFGIGYELSAKPKSDLYRDLLPLLNSGRVELLDHSRLITQLVGLERRTARGGRDSIDHAPNAHDDIANAVAGCLVGNAVTRSGLRLYSEGQFGPATELDPKTGRVIRLNHGAGWVRVDDPRPMTSRVRWVTIPERDFRPMRPPT